MKILSIIVTYYPNVNEVTNNILQIIDSVDKIIIWQNTPSFDSANFQINAFKDNEKVEYKGIGKNMGIAFALNQAYDILLVDSSYTHLLTLDQDSTWLNFNNFLESISISSQNSIYSPNINNELGPGNNFIKVKTCITSGAIFSVEVLRILGKFNEVYSVDCVDYEYCFRANQNKVPIYKIQNCNMNQVYGVPIKSKYLNIETNIYSAKRLFFIVRNHILLWRDYPDQIDYQFKKMILNSFIFGKILKVILIEKNKANKVISIIHGLLCGIINDRRARY